MGRDTKIGGYDPANDGIALSSTDQVGASDKSDIAIVCTRVNVYNSESHPPQEQAHCTITEGNVPHDPLADAIAALSMAYIDVLNMTIADAWYQGLITPQEARRIHEQRQVWQEVAW